MHHFSMDQIYTIIMPHQFWGNQIHTTEQVDIWLWPLIEGKEQYQCKNAGITQKKRLPCIPEQWC